MSIKIHKETDLQRDLINACIDLGGFGDKIQDKYLKGKSDIWLKLPSGIILFAEVKIVRNARFTITPEFTTLQLEYMEKLHENDLAVLGLIFAQSSEGYVDFKIAPYRELKFLFEKNHKIQYHISQLQRARSFAMIIKELEAFFVNSIPQVIRMS
jgi:hypothetical protein